MLLFPGGTHSLAAFKYERLSRINKLRLGENKLLIKFLLHSGMVISYCVPFSRLHFVSSSQYFVGSPPSMFSALPVSKYE